MKLKLRESDEHRLIYYERSYWFIGLPLALLGVSLLAGNGGEIILRWPHADGLFEGLGLGVCFTAIGSALMSSRHLLFDRAQRQFVATRRFLIFSRSKARPLSDFEAVVWEKKEKSDEGSVTVSFPVQLRGKRGDVEVCQVRRMDDARRLTHELGEFLGITQVHWDTHFLDPEFVVARDARGRQATLVASMRRFVGSPVIKKRIVGPGPQLVLSEKTPGVFGLFGKLLGAVMGLIGVFLMLIPVLGGTFNGRKDAFWEPILIGFYLVIAGPVIVLFRRGTTIDKPEQTACFWWGLPGLKWSRRHDLSHYSAVTYDERLETSPIVGRAVFKGAGVPDIVIHRSVDLEEVRSLAQDVAQFLGYGFVVDSLTASGEARHYNRI